MGQYSIGWYGDSWEPGGNTLWMSGFGGIRMFTNGQPRMSINRSGFVGIGTSTPDVMLSVNGQVRASCGLLICSDRNYKREIVPIAHALRDLLKLEGVSYYWRTDEFTNMGFTEDQQLGVIAQNVEAYFPQAVQTMPSGLKTVDYTKLVPVLIEALKEENSQRTANEQQLMRLIQDLADQNRDLQQQLDALKADTQKAAK
jgi:FtsZ-binding cell division protein ZapB